MAAVSNSSPLILYAAIGRLDLLRELFTEVIVPPAVWAEVVTRGTGRPGSVSIASMPWIQRRPLADEEPARTLRDKLGSDEAEPITLESEFADPVPLLLDDLKGRRVAVERGLFVTGSAGVLVLAKHRHLIPQVRPLLEDLRRAGRYLHTSAIEVVLSRAGEAPS